MPHRPAIPRNYLMADQAAYPDNTDIEHVVPEALRTMSAIEPVSARQSAPLLSQPRHPHQEIADMLAMALLRLRQPEPPSPASDSPEPVRLGFCPPQRVNANPSQPEGV